jgi:Flp/Fap pilin component.
MRRVIKNFSQLLALLGRNNAGATAIEYTIIVGLIAAAVVTGLGAIGSALGVHYNTASSAISTP